MNRFVYLILEYFLQTYHFVSIVLWSRPVMEYSSGVSSLNLAQSPLKKQSGDLWTDQLYTNTTTFRYHLQWDIRCIRTSEDRFEITWVFLWPFSLGSATLHAWQLLAQPHMGALLDHRPGVVTKGFRTLDLEQEQEDHWHLDQPEEDEVSCDSFTGLSGESSAPVDRPRSTSSPVCCNKNRDVDDNSRLETMQGNMCTAREGILAKDGHVEKLPLSFSCLSPSSLPSSSEMNGHVDLKELQDRMPGEGALSWGSLHCIHLPSPRSIGIKGGEREGLMGRGLESICRTSYNPKVTSLPARSRSCAHTCTSTHPSRQALCVRSHRTPSQQSTCFFLLIYSLQLTCEESSFSFPAFFRCHT